LDKVFVSKVSALLNNREGRPINEEDIYQYLTSQGYPISSMEDLKIDLHEMYSKGFIYPYQGYWYPTYHSEVCGAANISPDSKNTFRYPAVQYSSLLTNYEKVKPETRDKYKEEWKDKLTKYYDYFKKSHPEYSNFFKWVDQSSPNYYEFIKDAMAIFLQMNMEHNNIKYPGTQYSIPDELTTIEHAMNEAVYRLTTFMKKEHGAKVISPDIYRKAYDNVAELSAEIQSKFILEVISTSPSGTVISADTVKKFTETALKKNLPKEVSPDFFLNVIEGKLSNLKHSKEKGVFLYNTSATTIATYLQDALLKSPEFVSAWNTFMKTKGGFQGKADQITTKVWSGITAPGIDFFKEKGLDLEKVTISNSNLSNCNFTNADLSGTSITNCNLRGSLFKESVFKPSTFTGNDITKMDVDGAVLSKNITWDENKGQPINLVYREVSYDKKDLDNIVKSPQVYSYAFPLSEAEEGDALNLVYALKGYLDSLQILSFKKNNLLKLGWQIQLEFSKFENILKNKNYSYYIDNYTLIINHKGYVDLDALTQLPENIQFNNKGYVNLNSLTQLPENTQFNNKGDVELRSLTQLPENIQFNNEGYVSLDSLTQLPENIQFNNEGYVSLDALTQLPENKYNIFKNEGEVLYNLRNYIWLEFDPRVREGSLKLIKTSSLSDNEITSLKSWLESPENIPDIEAEDLRKWLADKNKSGELTEAGFNRKDINLLFGRASTLTGGPKKPPSEIARDKRNELSQNFAKAYGGKDSIPKTALLGVLTNNEGNLYDWLLDLPDKVTYKDIFNLYHALLSSLKQFHLTSGATTLTRKYEHLPYTTYVTDLSDTERGVSGKGTQFGVALVPIYNLMPSGVAEVAQRAVHEGTTHMYEGLAFSRIAPVIYHEIRSGVKGKIFKKVWAISEMQSDSYQKSGKSEDPDSKEVGDERENLHKEYYKTEAELDKAMKNFRRYTHHWPENLLNAIIELAQKHNVDEIWMPTSKDVVMKTGKNEYTQEAWYKYYDRPAKTFGGKLKNVGADISLDPGSSYSHKRAEWYVIPVKKQTKEGSLNFSSQDPSFNDYDSTRNDFFMYDKDQPSGNDSLDMQQSYYTDLMYLKDTDKEKKERDSLDWTGRENLQLGFGSLKLSWQEQPEERHFYDIYIRTEQGRLLPITTVYAVDKEQALKEGKSSAQRSSIVRRVMNYEENYTFVAIEKKSSSLKFSNDIYFDSTPSEDTTPEERNFTNPLPDKKLRRTDPKKYDRRHDWYSQSPDSEVSNRYDNSIPLEASLKLGWTFQPPVIAKDLYESGEWLKYIPRSMKPAKSRKYIVGEPVYITIGGNKPVYPDVFYFVGSCNSPYTGYYILVNDKGEIRRSNNIKKVEEVNPKLIEKLRKKKTSSLKLGWRTTPELGTLDALKNFISTMEPNVRYKFPNYPYEGIELEYEDPDDEGIMLYTWTLQRNWDYIQMPGPVFPLHGNMVVFWRKRQSAEKSLYKELKWFYDETTGELSERWKNKKTSSLHFGWKMPENINEIAKMLVAPENWYIRTFVNKKTRALILYLDEKFIEKYEKGYDRMRAMEYSPLPKGTLDSAVNSIKEQLDNYGMTNYTVKVDKDFPHAIRFYFPIERTSLKTPWKDVMKEIKEKYDRYVMWVQNNIGGYSLLISLTPRSPKLKEIVDLLRDRTGIEPEVVSPGGPPHYGPSTRIYITTPITSSLKLGWQLFNDIEVGDTVEVIKEISDGSYRLHIGTRGEVDNIQTSTPSFNRMGITVYMFRDRDVQRPEHWYVFSDEVKKVTESSLHFSWQVQPDVNNLSGIDLARALSTDGWRYVYDSGARHFYLENDNNHYIIFLPYDFEKDESGIREEMGLVADPYKKWMIQVGNEFKGTIDMEYVPTIAEAIRIIGEWKQKYIRKNDPRRASLKFSDLQDYPWDEIKHNLEHHFDYIINENRKKFPDVEEYVTDEMMAQFAYKTFFMEYNIPGVWRGDPEFVDEVKRIIKDDLGYKIYSPPYIDWFHWIQKAWDDIRYFLKNQRENIAPDMNVSDQELARDWLKLWQEEKQVPMDIQRAVWYHSVFLKAIQIMFEDKGLGDVLGTEYQAPQSPEERTEQILRPNTGVNEDEGDIPVDREGNPIPKEEDIWAGTNYKPSKEEVPTEEVPEVNTDELLDELHDAISKGDTAKADEIKKKLNGLQSKSSLKLDGNYDDEEEREEDYFSTKGDISHSDENALMVVLNTYGKDLNIKDIQKELLINGILAEQLLTDILEESYPDTYLLKFWRAFHKKYPQWDYILKNSMFDSEGNQIPFHNIRESSLKLSGLTPDDIFSGYPFIYDKKTHRLYVGEYNSTHQEMPELYSGELKEYGVGLQRQEDLQDNYNMGIKYIQGRVSGGKDTVAFWEQSSPTVDNKDDYTDCIFQLQQKEVVGSNPYIYFTGGYKRSFKDFVEFPAREASLKLSWQVQPETKIEVGGIKHRILQVIWKSPDHIGKYIDIQPVYGQAFQYFSQLQDKGCVERVAPGRYALTLTGRTILEILNGRKASLKFSWEVQPETYTVSPEDWNKHLEETVLYLTTVQFRSEALFWRVMRGIASTNHTVLTPELLYAGDSYKDAKKFVNEYVNYDFYFISRGEYDYLQKNKKQSSLVFNIDKKGQENEQNSGSQTPQIPQETQIQLEEKHHEKANEETSQHLQKTVISYPTLYDIIREHDDIIQEFGGLQGILAGGENRIEAAIGRMQSGFGDLEFYVSVLEKAAVLCHSIVTTHPFNDANKRIAFMSVVHFLYDNGFALGEADTFGDIIIQVADNNAGYEHLIQWLQANAKEIESTQGETLEKLTWKVLDPQAEEIDVIQKLFPGAKLIVFDNIDGQGTSEVNVLVKDFLKKFPAETDYFLDDWKETEYGGYTWNISDDDRMYISTFIHGPSEENTMSSLILKNTILEFKEGE
jgi:death-on-curing protein